MPDTPPHEQPPNRIPPVPTQMFYAVRGTDRISGTDVQTVIQAPGVEDARRIADQKSLTAKDIELMHPLNGAEAWKEAQADPNDRFNHPGDVNTPAAAPITEDPPAAASAPAAPVIESPTSHPEPALHPATDPTDQAQRPLGFATPGQSNTPRQRSAFSGSLGAGMVLTCLGGLIYVAVLRDPPQGAMADVYSASPQRPTAVITTPHQDAGYTDVDELIAASKKRTSSPILPRAQRGPGQTAYRVTHKQPKRPFGAAPARAPRAESLKPLVLTAITGRDKAHSSEAYINGQQLRVGQSIGGHRLIRILNDSVVLERNGHLIGLGFSTPDTESSE